MLPDVTEVAAHYLGTLSHQCSFCRALHWIAEKKATSSIARPVFGECCKSGEVDLPLLDPLPHDLQQLYNGRDRRAVDFRRHIRLYNKALAFTSTGGHQHLVGSSYDSRGPPQYKIHGEIFHRLGPLQPERGVLPVFSQLYVYDHNEALQYRKRLNPERDPVLMERLQTMLEHSHPLIDVYTQAYRLVQETSLTEYRLQLDFRKGCDRRRYNLPTADNELALIIPGDEDAIANEQHILLRPIGGPLVRISPCDPAFLTLHFPLLLPTGQPGWSPGISFVSGTENSTRHVSLADYAKFHLHPRPPLAETCHWFQATQLFQELLVHLWAAAEHSRLIWVRDNQKKLRAELYNGVVDALHEGVDLASIGKKVVLPASFTSGPRFMQRNLQNALALLRKFGGSDLFITFTANSGWREVQEALLPSQTASDRPDLVARVFHLKFESLLDDITKQGIFGEALGFVYTVEYQKRGLPHTHLIVFLARAARLSTPEAVDKYISTELPDAMTHQRLFDLVKQFMIHGPCGPGTSSPCMDGRNQCSKRFPKSFRANTEITGDSFVHTRRRDDGRFIRVGNHYVDNRSVISYCPYLTLRYEAHINVECTAGFHAVKYIYKVRYPVLLASSCTLTYVNLSTFTKVQTELLCRSTHMKTHQNLRDLQKERGMKQKHMLTDATSALLRHSLDLWDGQLTE